MPSNVIARDRPVH